VWRVWTIKRTLAFIFTIHYSLFTAPNYQLSTIDYLLEI
jgi:hypothetical protein